MMIGLLCRMLLKKKNEFIFVRENEQIIIMNTEFEKKIKGLNNFNNNEIKIIKSLEKKNTKTIVSIKRNS